VNSIILEVNNITKTFSKVVAVSDLSFTINKGEIFALLGPNGAGKTTTVRILTNIIKPDSGTINYFFNDSMSKVYKNNLLGYLPEERGLYQEIPIIKSLIYLGIIRGMDKQEARKSAEIWLDKLELFERRYDKLNTLSKGNQQKIQFISSILHNPVFAILDEPFSGFDPINQELFINIIKELALKGTTILLSAHQMQLVEKIADRVHFLHQGKTVKAGTIKEIKTGFMAEDIIYIKTKEQINELNFTNINDIKDFEKISNYECKLIVNNNLNNVLTHIINLYSIISIKSANITLHDIFIQLIKGKE
jgi:ABC-2 type transport system ATP-binding protein